MTEGRCGADINQIRESQPDGGLDWLDKFDTACGQDAGHEGAHVFSSEEGEQVHWDEATKRVGVYHDDPAPEQYTFSF
jgi:hypothetical protein